MEKEGASEKASSAQTIIQTIQNILVNQRAGIHEEQIESYKIEVRDMSMGKRKGMKLLLNNTRI
jgi:hypothetical protein